MQPQTFIPKDIINELQKYNAPEKCYALIAEDGEYSDHYHYIIGIYTSFEVALLQYLRCYGTWYEQLDSEDFLRDELPKDIQLSYFNEYNNDTNTWTYSNTKSYRRDLGYYIEEFHLNCKFLDKDKKRLPIYVFINHHLIKITMLNQWCPPYTQSTLEQYIDEKHVELDKNFTVNYPMLESFNFSKFNIED